MRVPTRLRRPEARHATGVEGRVELVGDGGWIRQQLEDRDDVLAALPAAGVRLREQQDVDELGAHLDHVRTAAGQVVQQLADERALREVFVSDRVLERAGVVACPQRPIRREQRSVAMEAALSERANRRVNLLAAPFRLGHRSLPSCSLFDENLTRRAIGRLSRESPEMRSPDTPALRGATLRQLSVGAADSPFCHTAAVSFHPLPDHELQQLADEQLIAYIRDARDAGELAHGRRGLMFLVYGYERDVKRRLSIKVPKHVVDDLAHDALVKAIAAAFDGSSVGEFRCWLHTIVDRTAVDFFRRAERRPKETILPSEHAGEEGVWGAEPAVDSEAGAVELRIIVEEVLETFNEKHRLVIELHVFGGLTAAEVCGRIEGMSEDNVAQIASRFRAKLRARLDPSGSG